MEPAANATSDQSNEESRVESFPRFVATFSPRLSPWRKQRCQLQIAEGSDALTEHEELRDILALLQRDATKYYSPARARLCYLCNLLLVLLGFGFMALRFALFKLMVSTDFANWLVAMACWFTFTGLIGCLWVYEAAQRCIALTVQHLHRQTQQIQEQYGDALKITMKVFPGFELKDISSWPHKLGFRQEAKISCTFYGNELQYYEMLQGRDHITECCDIFFYPPVVLGAPLWLASARNPPAMARCCKCRRGGGRHRLLSETGSELSGVYSPTNDLLLGDKEVKGSDQGSPMQPARGDAPPWATASTSSIKVVTDGSEEGLTSSAEQKPTLNPSKDAFFFDAVPPHHFNASVRKEIEKSIATMNSMVDAVFPPKWVKWTRGCIYTGIFTLYLSLLCYALFPDSVAGFIITLAGIVVVPLAFLAADILHCVKLQKGRVATVRTLLSGIEGLRRHRGWRGPTWYRRRVDGEVHDEVEGLSFESEEESGQRGHRIDVSRRRGVEPRGYLSPSAAARPATRHRQPSRDTAQGLQSPGATTPNDLVTVSDPASPVQFTTVAGPVRDAWRLSGIELVFPCKFVSDHAGMRTRALAGSLAPYVPHLRGGEADPFATAWLFPWLRFRVTTVPAGQAEEGAQA